MTSRPRRSDRPKKEKRVGGRVRECLAEERLKFSDHALTRMVERGIRVLEVIEILRRTRRAPELDAYDTGRKSWNYALVGKDALGERALMVAVSFVEEGNMLVITAIDLEEDYLGVN